MEEVLCIGCGEDRYYYCTSEFDENVHGHLHCVELYDKKLGRQEQYNTPRRNEFILVVEHKIKELQNDLQVVKSYTVHSFILKN